MTLLMTYKGNPPYEVDKLWVALNNWDGTFGTSIEVAGVNMLVGSRRLKTLEGMGNRRIIAQSGKVLAIPITFRALAIPMDAYEMIMNTVVSDYGTTPNRYQQMETGAGDEPQSFGVLARIKAAQSTGGLYYFWPFVSVRQDIEWRFDGDNYVSTEMRCEAIGDPVLTKADGSPLLERFRNYETLPTITSMPLL